MIAGIVFNEPPPEYYTHLSNGDFSIPENDMDDLLASVDFEMVQGSQKYMIITRNPLTIKQYEKICKILEI